MLARLSDAELRRRRLRSQRLAGRPAAGVPEAVRGAAGLQAQDTKAARLAVRPRSTGTSAATVTAACNDDRSVVRTWVMRGTLHMVASEDAGWLVGLLGPVFAARDAGRRRQLGLDEDTCERGLTAIREVLAAGVPLTRPELIRQIADQGVVVDPRSQAPAHLVVHAARMGLVCRGPDLAGDEPTYVGLAGWVGEQPALEPDAALAELARRHLGAYGPADALDFAAWSGLGVGRARHAFELIADELDEVVAGGRPAWVLAADAEPVDLDPPPVRLLGHFDAYLLGYRGRDLVLDPRFARRIQAGGGFIQPAVLVDGRVAGTWRQRRGRARLTVAVAPFERLDPAVVPGLEAEVTDLGRFLDTDVELLVERASGRAGRSPSTSSPT